MVGEHYFHHSFIKRLQVCTSGTKMCSLSTFSQPSAESHECHTVNLLEFCNMFKKKKLAEQSDSMHLLIWLHKQRFSAWVCCGECKWQVETGGASHTILDMGRSCFFLWKLETFDRDWGQGALSGEITQKGVRQEAAVYSLGRVPFSLLCAGCQKPNQ